MRPPLKTLMVVVLSLLMAGPFAQSLAQVADKAPSVNRYNRTVVAASLKIRMVKGKNIPWCASMQIAWDKLTRLLGGPVGMVDAPPAIASLNAHLTGHDDLDPDSYFVFAGLNTTESRKEILREL